ncbi:MAG: rod shape-determining protein MreC [Deltaproteobacteria bacterium]|nr:rod shape-determining protein MreC [Candidatus Tharpella sp.]
MTAFSRRLPWLLSLALVFTFFTLCISFGLQKGGSLLNIAERATLAMTYPIQKGIDLTFSTGGKLFDSYIKLVGVKERNHQLEKDLALIKNRLAQLEETHFENLRLHKLLNFKKQHDTLTQGIAAHVIGRQTDNLSHILIIDCGSNQNLKVNNPVFTTGGVIGRIIACGPRSAKVLLLVDQNSACDVIIQRNRIRGTLQGTGNKFCQLAYLQRTADVKVGDRLITSGLDNIFPKGITVGTVVTTTQCHNGLSQTINVKPEFDLNTIEEVYVIPSPPNS